MNINCEREDGEDNLAWMHRLMQMGWDATQISEAIEEIPYDYVVYVMRRNLHVYPRLKVKHPNEQ